MDKDVDIFRKKVVDNMKQVVRLMLEIEDLNTELTNKYDESDAGYFFNNYLPCGQEYPFNLSFDEQISQIDGWVKCIEDERMDANKKFSVEFTTTIDVEARDEDEAMELATKELEDSIAADGTGMFYSYVNGKNYG